jgi:hypothetical protein
MSGTRITGFMIIVQRQHLQMQHMQISTCVNSEVVVRVTLLRDLRADLRGRVYFMGVSANSMPTITNCRLQSEMEQLQGLSTAATALYPHMQHHNSSNSSNSQQITTFALLKNSNLFPPRSLPLYMCSRTSQVTENNYNKNNNGTSIGACCSLGTLRRGCRLSVRAPPSAALTSRTIRWYRHAVSLSVVVAWSSGRIKYACGPLRCRTIVRLLPRRWTNADLDDVDSAPPER